MHPLLPEAARQGRPKQAGVSELVDRERISLSWKLHMPSTPCQTPVSNCTDSCLNHPAAPQQTNLRCLHSSQQLYKKISQSGVFRRVITFALSRRRWAASYHSKMTRKNLSMCVVLAGCFKNSAARDQRANDNREVGRHTPTEAHCPPRGCTPRSTKKGWRQRMTRKEFHCSVRRSRGLRMHSLVFESSSYSSTNKLELSGHPSQ